MNQNNRRTSAMCILTALWMSFLISDHLQASATVDTPQSDNCPKDITMTQIRELGSGQSMPHNGRLLKAASLKNIQDILPSTWSPTSYTALAHLRKPYENEGIIVCEYGFKSAIGSTVAKVKFWQSKDHLDNTLDYRFSLYHNPHEEKEAVSVAPDPSHEKKEPRALAIHPKATITQEDIQKDKSLKDHLTVLDLVNNPRISWGIVEIQYNLLSSWKTGAELEKVHQAFQDLKPYFGR
ncbi:MAG: hypothetical protein C0514_04110 [Candidatus Puniceispirillum sp.]|nr:hypothetical protein [Candidatus Puniceispirillum sp.]